jgi:Holliday junction resolvase RusA-like endonuclease
MPTEILKLWVSGKAKTKGSMRHIGGGRMVQGVVGSTAWARSVRSMVKQGLDRGDVVPVGRHVPVCVRCVFFVRPPQTRSYDTPIHERAGDLDKLERNVLDALTTDPRKDYRGIFPDDVQVISLSSERVFAQEDFPAGAFIGVWALDRQDLFYQNRTCMHEVYATMIRATVPSVLD